jgi:zinc protease
MLQSFHRTWYAPNNAILVIAGDVDPSRAVAGVRDLFGDIPAKRIPEKPQIRLKAVRPTTFDLKTDRPYGMVAMSFRFPGTDSPDFAAARVLADALASERGDLFALTVQGKALFTDFSLDSLPVASVSSAMAAFPTGANASALTDEMRQVVIRASQRGIAADLVEAAKRRAITKAELETTSVSDLAMRWSEALAVEGRSSPEDDLEAIRKVTAEVVNRVARQYLDLGHAVTAVLTPETSGKPTSSKSFGGPSRSRPRRRKQLRFPSGPQRCSSAPRFPPRVFTPRSPFSRTASSSSSRKRPPAEA